MTIYRERLWASPWLYLAFALVIPASLLVFLPINPAVGVVVALGLYAAISGALIFSTPTVAVSTEEFTAGRARLPIRFVGAVTEHRGAEASLQRGQLLDARAWLMIRGWVSPVIKIEVTDPADPVPYWLVSTRHPDRVAKAIAEAKRRTPGK